MGLGDGDGSGDVWYRGNLGRKARILGGDAGPSGKRAAFDFRERDLVGFEEKTGGHGLQFLGLGCP